MAYQLVLPVYSILNGSLNNPSIKPMGPNVATLPVVNKDLPNSPRFTPYEFYRDESSALLQLVNQWLDSTYSRSYSFRCGRKNTSSGDENRTQDFRTSRCAGHLLDHSGVQVTISLHRLYGICSSIFQP